MKLNFAMIAVLLTTFASAPAFADWDMPNASAVGSTIASNVANVTSEPVIQTAYADVSGLASSGFDLSSLGSTISNATAGDATVSQQQPEYTANTTNATGTQAVSTLPECRTHTLSCISGPVNANGLPPCTLDSFVYMSLTNIGKEDTDKIYGDEGRSGPPQLNVFSPINAGIAGPSAEGLTTGHAQ
jgi:hypothetical protein